MVLSDILKRWQVLKGKKAILCTGTDEHGLKIQQAAAAANTPPKEFCDLTAETFKTLAARAGLSNDHFVRTTDPDHKDAVQYFWFMLRDREYIYESKHEGWYCVSDETYYPESTIEKRLDPYTGRTFMASSETGKEVEWTSEKNYHFRLSLFRDRLLEFYKANPDFIKPASRMQDVITWVSQGLEDLSISRPLERLSWGIRVPDDETQTIYVWLDALVNYITKAGYPWAPGKESALGWPADVQVIGKDIVRFHCIYWPAFLMALDLAPPKQILTHAHWTLNRQKMAKSTGNVVNPFFAIDRFGIDVMRYYLAHDGGIQDDSDYGNHLIVKQYKKGLQGGLGNLVARITRPKPWSVREAVSRASSADLTNPFKSLPKSSPELSAAHLTHVGLLTTLSTSVDQKFAELNPGAALQTIMDAVFETNKYLQLNAPWALRSSIAPDASDATKAAVQANIDEVIYHCAEATRIVGILLLPYMPTKAAELLDRLGVSEEKRTFQHAVLGADLEYGAPFKPPGGGAYEALFPPLVVDR